MNKPNKPPRAKHLIWNRVDAGPQFTCNVCSHHYTNSQWRVADIPIHNGRDTANVVVCSKACQKEFIRHPDADRYVADLVERTEQMESPEPTPQDMSQIADFLREAFKGGPFQIDFDNPIVRKS